MRFLQDQVRAVSKSEFRLFQKRVYNAGIEVAKTLQITEIANVILVKVCYELRCSSRQVA